MFGLQFSTGYSGVLAGTLVLLAWCLVPRVTVSAEPVADPAYVAQERLATAYAHVELLWVLTGEYPQSVEAVAKPGLHSLFPSLRADALNDPWSVYGQPFRYRVTDAGPQLASIGPDQRWGGWQGEDTFFGLDDLTATARTIPQLVRDYLHSVYCVERQRGRLAYPSPRVEFPSVVHVTPAKVEAMGLRKAHAPLGSLEQGNVSTYLEQEWHVQMFLRPLALSNRFTGLKTALPAAYLGSRPTLGGVAGALAEASPFWTAANVIREDAWVLYQPLDVSSAACAFDAIVSLEEYAAAMDALATMVAFCQEDLSDAILVFAQAHLTDEQLGRLEEALRRMFGEEHISARVVGDDIVVTGFRSLSQLFFAVDALGAIAPPIDTFLDLRKKLAERAVDSPR